jgi:hypothetical protein
VNAALQISVDHFISATFSSRNLPFWLIQGIIVGGTQNASKLPQSLMLSTERA